MPTPVAKELTVERVRELLHYDKESGQLFWRKSSSGIKAGIAGGYEKGSYIAIRVDKKRYRAHRLIWFYVTGEWPKHDIDHINGIKDDNRLCNLRDVTRSVNKQNIKHAKSQSKTGLLGAAPYRGAFRADININGRSKYLGKFSTAQEAHNAYLSAKRQNHIGNTL